MRTERSRLLATAALAWSLAACAPVAPPAPPADTPAPALELEYSGCDAIFAVAEPDSHPTCVLRAQRKLDLWVSRDRGARLEVRVPPQGGQRNTGERMLETEQGEAMGGGLLFRLTDLGAGELDVRAFRDGAESRRRLTLEEPLPGDDGVALHRTFKEQGWAAARDLLETRAADLEPFAAGLLVSVAVRRVLEVDLAEARALAERAVDLHRAADNSLYLINDLALLHFLLLESDELEAARDVLFRQMPEPAGGDGESAFWLAFYRGQWAVNNGDARNALRELEAAARHAGRLGWTLMGNQAHQLLARQLRRLGRGEEATHLFARLVAEIDQIESECDKAKLLNNAAWDRLLALEARWPAANPLPELEQALVHLEACRRDFGEEVNLRLNLALAHYHAGDAENARLQLGLAQAGTEQPERRLLAWSHDLEGRLNLLEGRPRAALDAYAALAALAAAGDWPEVAWRAAVGRASALEVLGEIDAALEELARAEVFLDQESLRAPLDAGRETSVAAREWATRHLLDLLLRRGREEDALRVARRARGRYFRGLATGARRQDLSAGEETRWITVLGRYQRQRAELETAVAGDWAVPGRQRPALAAERGEQRQELGRLLDEALSVLDAGEPAGSEEPPPPRPGELLLAYHPAPEGWFLFAAGVGELEVHRLPPVDPAESSAAELATRWLEPLAERIHRAERLRLLPYGPLRAVDFHALPFAGAVLADAKPVVYGLDLPPVAAAAGRRALVIADPTGSLPAAPREAALVEEALTGRGDRAFQVLPGDASSLRDLLPRIDLLHFAGHADFTGHGLDSGLTLDRDGALRLTAGDILTLPAAPAAVVLSACESARSGAGDAPVTLGIAHAFLLAGSRTVIGATRPVDDGTTAALVRHLYALWDGTPASAAAALAGAQRALRRQDPNADWQAFRVLER